VNRGKKSKGIALISVLFIAAVVLILASTFIFTIVRERQSATSSKLMNDSLQVADALSERARMQILQAFDSSSYTPANFLLELREGSSPDLNAMLAASADITVEGRTGKWRISDYTGKNTPASDVAKYLNNPATIKWIEVSATVTTATGTQTVIRRINMGEGELFRLAMLARNTNCIYCHLRVNGDVGSLGDLRPGWGHELDGVAPLHGWEDGWNSGNGSKVDGNVYIATVASEDANENMTDAAKSDPSLDKKINGTVFTGVVEEGYKQSPLPRDKNDDGEPDFPYIERERAIKNAKGSIASAKQLYVIPLNSPPLTTLPTTNSTGLGSVINGNLILEGTFANPIKLDGDIYVTGDVIIKGYVQGRGAIYSGRNTYVAGNIQYKNPPPNCATEPNPDTCARDAIAAGKDELRLAARNNIVLGDYTETTTGGVEKTWQGRQSADYYRAQFGFNTTDSSKNKFFDKTNGDELTLSGSVYKDVEGNTVASGNVEIVNARAAYNYSFQPGMVDSDNGSFDNWLPDKLYQDFLGKEERKYDTWRYNISDRTALTLADLREQFSAYGVSDASLSTLLCAASPCPNGNLELKNDAGQVVGQINWNAIANNPSDPNNPNLPNDADIRVIIDSAVVYEKQVTKVDAFLYANQRIAGKTFNAPLAINGGMIGQEIGVLAPGIERQWWMDETKYEPILNGNENRCKDATFVKQFTTESDHTKSPAYNTDAMDCALTINYDFRLRNGGLGFNLVTPDAGQTMSWRLADSKAERVE
jgi:hypothetical protein